MEISTEHLNRCVQTLNTSLDMLRESAVDSPEYEVFRNAVIKGFELTLETAGKLLRRALKEYSTGSPRAIDSLSYKELFRHALKHGLIKDPALVERWFEYRDNRNSTAHDYGIGFAHETLGLLPDFLNDVRELEKSLREKFCGGD